MTKSEAARVWDLARKHLSAEEIYACLDSALDGLPAIEQADVIASERQLIGAVKKAGPKMARETVARIGLGL